MKFNISSKLKLAWQYVVDNWKIYVGTNILYGLIGALVALFWLWLVFVGLKNLITSGLEINYFLFILGIGIIVLWWRLWKALSFVANFYVTKNYKNGEKMDFSEVFKKWFRELKNRVLVDLWYFLIALAVIGGFALLVILAGLIGSVINLTQILIIVVVVISLYFMVKVALMFCLADYYCFDKWKFDFKTFLSARNIVKGKYLYLIVNLIALFLILFVVSLIFMLPFQGINPHITYNSIHSIDDLQILFMTLFTFWAILYKLISYLVWIMVNIYSFVYLFFVYEEMKQEDEENVEKKEDPAA